MREGSRYFWVGAVAAAVAIGAAAPASASRQGCLDRAKSTATIIKENDKAIVLEVKGVVKGCAYDTEKLNKLPGQKRGSRITRPSVRVKGRYAGYAAEAGSDLYVYSAGLRRGKEFGSSVGSGAGQNVALDKLVMRANGSFAWQISYPADNLGSPTAWTAVWKFDQAGRRQVDIDTDSSYGRAHRIVRGSLRLGDGIIAWRRMGEAKERPFAFR
jgi:hypothetical protein